MQSSTQDTFVGLRHTLAFVEEMLEPCSLVEIGCGDGRLAAVLGERGFRVLGVDVDGEMVECARGRGVEVIRADVQELEAASLGAAPFGAVLFSRSLHHVADPRRALDRTRSLLGSGGSLLIEDFARDLVDERAAAWRYDGETFLRRGRDDAAAAAPIELVPDPLAAWRQSHPDHHLHDLATLQAAVDAQLPGARQAAVPYLYRYLLAALSPGAEGERLGAALLEWEAAWIRRGLLPAIGRRWWWQRSS